MSAPVPVSEPSLHTDYFIARAAADRELAMWVGRFIAAQGKTYILEDDHFGHQDFMDVIDRAFKSGARVVALQSQAFLESDWCMKEARTALQAGGGWACPSTIWMLKSRHSPDMVLATRNVLDFRVGE
jgi:hypothetical protein